MLTILKRGLLYFSVNLLVVTCVKFMIGFSTSTWWLPVESGESCSDSLWKFEGHSYGGTIFLFDSVLVELFCSHCFLFPFFASIVRVTDFYTCLSSSISKTVHPQIQPGQNKIDIKGNIFILIFQHMPCVFNLRIGDLKGWGNGFQGLPPQLNILKQGHSFFFT